MKFHLTVMVSPSEGKGYRIVLKGSKGKVKLNSYINSKSILKGFMFFPLHKYF